MTQPAIPTPGRAFEEGLDARERGKRPVDNPYCMRTAEHREWLAGLSATCDLDEDEDPNSLRTSGSLAVTRD